MGVSQATFYLWRKKFGGLGVSVVPPSSPANRTYPPKAEFSRNAWSKLWGEVTRMQDRVCEALGVGVRATEAHTAKANATRLRDVGVSGARCQAELIIDENSSLSIGQEVASSGGSVGRMSKLMDPCLANVGGQAVLVG